MIALQEIDSDSESTSIILSSTRKTKNPLWMRSPDTRYRYMIGRQCGINQELGDELISSVRQDIISRFFVNSVVKFEEGIYIRFDRVEILIEILFKSVIRMKVGLPNELCDGLADHEIDDLISECGRYIHQILDGIIYIRVIHKKPSVLFTTKVLSLDAIRGGSDVVYKDDLSKLKELYRNGVTYVHCEDSKCQKQFSDHLELLLTKQEKEVCNLIFLKLHLAFSLENL